MKKKITFLLACFLLSAATIFAQYCMLPGRTPYASVQPGITNFSLNTINRTSGNSESATSVVVTTGLSTTLTAGQVYTVSITHSEDVQSFPGSRNNIRVWIDYSNNFSYTDAGETVITGNQQTPGTTFTGTFIVPTTVASGTYALRATAKMGSDAGHTTPTSCDNPADPLGYHGEMEDYSIVVVNSNPTQNPSSTFAMSSTVCVDASTTATNSSVGTPIPTYAWSATPSANVTFAPTPFVANPQITIATAGSYTITCTASNSYGSNASSKTVVASDCTVGLKDLSEAVTFDLGPNPVAGVLNIYFYTEYENATLMLVNALGQQVLQKQLSGTTAALDLSPCTPGIYLLTVSGNKGIAHRQVIVNR